ncbi:MAG: hypothetical protein PHC92_05405 [Syntrophomonadaceae bacterium]|nr:hypothetical protein [Syntrophomonadaceae bacterium]MDD3022983.1 hypothetical protein [Syntrophomonadaceae bacterium]
MNIQEFVLKSSDALRRHDTLICILLVIFGRLTMQSKVPFTPFLGIGAAAIVFFQPQIWFYRIYAYWDLAYQKSKR